MTSESRTIQLPSGRTAVLRPGRGKDLIHAYRAVGENPEPTAVSFSLIAELVRVDDKPLVYEEVLDMPLDDVLVLQAEVVGGGTSSNFPETAGAQGPSAETEYHQPRRFSTFSNSDSRSQS